jgi:hypothetical protein
MTEPTSDFINRIEATLLDKQYQKSFDLWRYLRSVDGGQGYVTASLDEIAEALNIEVPIIQQWIEQGREIGLFRRCVKIEDEKYRIFYSSPTKVRLNLSQRVV